MTELRVAEKAWDRALSENPPVITWRRKYNGVLVAVHVDDPHKDGGANAAKAECKRGHEFTDENTIITADGRQCRTCKYERRAELTPEQKKRANELRNVSRRRLRELRRAA